MFDYEMLRLVWWVLVGVLLIGFAITDGFDMGVGALLPFVGKKDVERRVMLNTMGPHWEGNQVWLVTAGGALFAAWPMVYAAAFSGFYIAMILTLMALFFRPVGFKYRSLREDAKWRSNWDWALFVGSAVPPIVFGVAFGNLLQGVPFDFNQFMMLTYHGNFFGLLNPFGLLAGLVSLFMLVTQGATWLMMKTDGEVLARSRTAAMICSLLTLVLFGLAGFLGQRHGRLCGGQGGRDRCRFQSDEQGSGASGRSLDEQLQPLSLDGCSTCAGSGHEPADRAVRQTEQGLAGVHYLLPGGCWRDPDCGLLHVPVRDAFQS